MKKIKFSDFFKTIIKLFLLGLFFLTNLEIIARIDDWIRWGAPPLGNYSKDNLKVIDDLGIRNRPDSQFQKWRINQHGFRGPGITIEKPSDMNRVMVLGASETFGLYESQNMEYPAQLQKALDEKKPGYFQVINAAVPGITPPRLTHLYKNWLYKFDADVVIYYPSPAVYLLHQPPGPFVLSDTKPVQNTFELRITAKAQIVYKRFIPAMIQTNIKRYKISWTVASHPKSWLFDSPPPDRIPLFRDHITELVRTIQSDGSKVILATHATRISNEISEEDRRALVDQRMILPHVTEKCFLAMELSSNTVIKEVATITNSYIIDIEAQIPDSKKYLIDYAHFTNEGARLMAILLAKELLSIAW